MAELAKGGIGPDRIESVRVVLPRVGLALLGAVPAVGRYGWETVVVLQR